MELNINSPAYFTNHYGVDDEVYRYCQNLHNYFKTKTPATRFDAICCRSFFYIVSNVVGY